MICTVCCSVLLREQHHTKQPRYNTEHHLTALSLITAVAAKCYICNRFWARLTTEERDLVSRLTPSTSVENPYAEVDIHGRQNWGHVTSCDLSDATAFGFPRCYLLSIGFENIGISARANLIIPPLNRKNLDTLRVGMVGLKLMPMQRLIGIRKLKILMLVLRPMNHGPWPRSGLHNVLQVMLAVKFHQKMKTGVLRVFLTLPLQNTL